MSQWPGQPVSGQQEQQWPGQPVTVSRRTTANQAFPEGIRLTEAQRRAYAAIPDLDISGQSGTRQRPFALPANDDGSNMQVGTFGITADGRLVEGRAPRPVAMGGGPSPDDIQGMLETFPFGRRFDETAFRNQLQNDPVAMRLEQRPGVLGGLQEQFTNAVTFGQNPRIQGFLGGVAAGVPEALATGNLGAIPAAIDTRTNQMMDRREMLRQQMPVTSFAGEVAGGIVGGGLAGRAAMGGLGNVAAGASRAAPAAQLTQRGIAATGQFARGGLAQAAAVGAGAGAGMGALQGLGERNPIQGAQQGAVAGAVGGAVAPYVARGVGGAAEFARRAAGRPSMTPEQVAARRIQQRLAEDAPNRTADAQRLGLDPLTPLDLMNNRGRRMVRAFSAVGDDTQEAALEYGRQTAEALPDRAAGIAQQMTGRPVNIEQLRAAAAQNLSDVDSANYSFAPGVRVPITREIMDAFNTSRGREALQRAIGVADTQRRQADIAGLGRMLQAYRTGGNPANNIRPSEGEAVQAPITVSLDALENAYRVMRDTGRGMAQSTGEQATMRVEGGALTGEAQRVGGLLAAQFPEIAAARAASQEARQGVSAIDEGLTAFQSGVFPEQVQTAYSSLPASAQPNMLAAAQASLQRGLNENPSAVLGMMASRPSFPQRVAAMGVDPANMRLAAQIEQRRLRNAQFISPNAGSPTQLRQAEAAENGLDIGNIPVTQAGFWGRMATSAVNLAVRRGSGMTGAEMEALVRMATSPADLEQLARLAADRPSLFTPEALTILGAQTAVSASAPR